MGSGLFRNIRFCPKCGVRSVVKDDYKITAHNAWLCESCGFGFRVIPSLRHIEASALLKKHRAKNFVEMSPKKVKEIPDDAELHHLQMWLVKIRSKTTVRRSKKNQTLFVFESASGVNHSTAVDFKRAVSFMAGLTEGLIERDNER